MRPETVNGRTNQTQNLAREHAGVIAVAAIEPLAEQAGSGAVGPAIPGDQLGSRRSTARQVEHEGRVRRQRRALAGNDAVDPGTKGFVVPDRYALAININIVNHVEAVSAAECGVAVFFDDSRQELRLYLTG